MSDYQYVGSELDLFAASTNWKGYLHRQIRPYLGREILEVGAGLGGTTRHFSRGEFDRWVCLEPDADLARRLEDSISKRELPEYCRAVVGTLEGIGADRFDTLLYIDVLEHIEDDANELALAADRLRPGGHVVVLSPAHPFLYTPFDKAIGHFRRYTRASLKAIGPPGLDLCRLCYLDSVGMLASLGNLLILRSESPTRAQIALWDKVMVPMSGFIDPLLGHSLGKSVLAVWRKSDPLLPADDTHRSTS